MKKASIDLRYRAELNKLFSKPGAAAEIGVAEGNFSEDMLRWKIGKQHAVTRLYMVDRWKSVPTQFGDASMPQEWHEKNLAQVLKRTVPYGDRAVILEGDSKVMADEVEDGELTLLYIDGDHTEEGCFSDLRAWTPKVKRGGFVALHDFLNENYGVRKAVETFCRGAGFEIHILEENKSEDAGAWFQII